MCVCVLLLCAVLRTASETGLSQGMFKLEPNTKLHFNTNASEVYI